MKPSMTNTQPNTIIQSTQEETKKPSELLLELSMMHLRNQQQQNLMKFWGGGSGGSKADWEGWLRDKGLLRRNDSEHEQRAANGWTDPDDDLSDMEDDAWIAGGIKRPGEKDSEEYTTDEALEDDWDKTDNDDDDHGGHMMPIPGM